MNAPATSLVRLLTASLLTFLVISPLRAEEGFSADAVFDRAHAAYVAGNYAEAMSGYQELTEHGFATKETWFNHGNAAFRLDKAGEAILSYRRAWLLDPRDADVKANFNLVAQRTGALVPEPGWMDRIGQEFSRAEWKTIMVWSYWIAMAALITCALAPAARRFGKPTAIAALVAAIIGCAGWTYWILRDRHSEAVVTARDQKALYEPRESATPYFALPEGSLVRIEEAFDAWLKVSAAGKSGWIMKSAVTRVYPWHEQENR